MPRAVATENQRCSAVEYVLLVEGCTVHVYSAIAALGRIPGVLLI